MSVSWDGDGGAAGKPIQVLFNDAGLGIAQVGTVCMVVWRSAAIQERFDRQRAALEAAAAQYPGRACPMCVIEPGAPPPDSRMRRASLDMLDAVGEQLACVACVIEGSGFRAATTRSVLSGMAMLFRRKLEVAFMANVTEAAHWVARYCDGATVAGLEQARAQLGR